MQVNTQFQFPEKPLSLKSHSFSHLSVSNSFLTASWFVFFYTAVPSEIFACFHSSWYSLGKFIISFRCFFLQFSLRLAINKVTRFTKSSSGELRWRQFLHWGNSSPGLYALLFWPIYWKFIEDHHLCQSLSVFELFFFVF